MPSAFNPSGFGRRAAARIAGAIILAGAAGVAWWQTHLATSPSCQITAPAAGTVTGTVPVTATCGSTATGVDFRLNGASIGSDGTFPFTVSWNSALIPDGSYTLTAVSQDASGNTATSPPVAVTTSNGTGGGGGSGTANVWVNALGNDSTCAYHATAVADPGGSGDCVTPEKACQLITANATHGTVNVDGGTYAGGFNYDCTPSGTITYTVACSTFADFQFYGAISGNNVTLQGCDVGHGVGFSLGHTAVSGTNVALNDVNFYCQVQAGSPWIQLAQSDSGESACNDSVVFQGTNETWDGGDQEDEAVCLAHCTYTNTPNGVNVNDDFVTSNASTILVEHVTQKNIWGMDPTGLSPPLHHEIWFFDGGNTVEFLDDSITDCAPPAATGYPVNTSCNSAVIFVGFTGGTYPTTDNVSLIQDVIAGGHTGQKAYQQAHLRPSGYEYHFTADYDSLDGSLTLCGVSANPCDGATITGANIALTGNVGILSSVGCFTAAAYSHNDWFQPSGNSASCGATDQHFNSTPDTTFWAAPGPASYNYAPLAILQGAGENTVCATIPGGVDIDGVTRPTATPCDLGAVEH